MPVTREKGKSESEKGGKVGKLLSDPNQLLSFIKDPDSDLSILSDCDQDNGLIMMKLFQTIMISNQALVDSNSEVLEKLNQTEEKLRQCEDKLVECEGRYVECQSQLVECQGKLVTLDKSCTGTDDEVILLRRRVVQLEQYSRRSTIIMTGIPYETEENIEDKVCEFVNRSKVISIDSSHLAHVHRNKVKVGSSRPPSTTVVLHKSSLVDRLLYQKQRFRSANVGANVFPAMSIETQNLKDHIEGCNEVLWCDFRGHSRWFTVKMKSGEFYNGISDAFHLAEKAGSLTHDPVKFAKLRAAKGQGKK